MSTDHELPPDDPRQDAEFAIHWASMAELDWLAFTEDDDSPALHELSDAHSRLVARRRRRHVIVAVLIALALGAAGLRLLQ